MYILYAESVTIILRIRKECHVNLTVANVVYIPIIPRFLSGVLSTFPNCKGGQGKLRDKS